MGFSADTLEDRVAIVTGASQGIGRAIAVELAGVGAHVVACSRRRSALEPVADAVRAAGRRALALECDVGDARQVDAAVARALEEFGRIDLLVNNAGYRIRSPLEDLPRREWDAMVQTNLTGVFLFRLTTFDAIHDQARPLNVLKGIRRALKPDGVYLMQDISGSSDVRKDIEHPIGVFLYTISCMHCMTVSLAQGGEGLGAMWGEEKTREYLQQAGFRSITTHRLAHDIQNNWYVVTR